MGLGFGFVLLYYGGRFGGSGVQRNPRRVSRSNFGGLGAQAPQTQVMGFFKFNTPIYYGFIIILFCVARSVFGQNIFIHFCLIVFLVNYLFLVIIYKLFLKDDFLVSVIILLDTIWWIG